MKPGHFPKYSILVADKAPVIRASLKSCTLGYVLSNEAIHGPQFLVKCYNLENVMFQAAEPPFLCLI